MTGLGVLWGAGTQAELEAADPHALAPSVADLRALLLP